MRKEDDYTGSPVGDDDDIDFLANDADLYEFDPEEDALADAFAALAENEQMIRIAPTANGAKSLAEIAEKLYDFADDLIAMSEEGWEIVDDVVDGHATAVQFAAIESDET